MNLKAENRQLRQLSQLIIYGKYMTNWIEEFVTRGRFILAEMYQLRYNALDLCSGIQEFEQNIAERKPRDEIIISDLRTAYDLVITEEHKKKLFAWREQHLFKVKTYEEISIELVGYKQKVANILKFVSTFMSQIPCQYRHEDDTYFDLGEVQTEFQNFVHGSFNGDPLAFKMNHMVSMSAKFDEAAEKRKELLNLIADGEEMLEKHYIILDSINVPDEEAINNFLEDMISQE